MEVGPSRTYHATHSSTCAGCPPRLHPHLKQRREHWPLYCNRVLRHSRHSSAPWAQPKCPRLIEIHTKEGARVAQPVRMSSEKKRVALNAKIREMQDLGVIEPSTSDWNSPVGVYEKPDKSYRFVQDLRMLNAVADDVQFVMADAQSIYRRRYFSTQIGRHLPPRSASSSLMWTVQ
jgi:hypothetical protein